MKLPITSSRVKITLIMMIFVIPLVVFLISYNFYMMNVLKDNVAQTGMDTIYVYQKPMVQELHDIENAMVNILANDSSYQQWAYSADHTNSYLDSKSVLEKLKNRMSTGSAVAGFFTYDLEFDFFWEAYNGSYSYESKEEMKLYLKTVCGESASDAVSKWSIEKMQSQYYLTRVMKRNDAYMMCVYDLEKAEKPQFNANNSEDSFLFFADENYLPLTSMQAVEEQQITLEQQERNYYTTGGAKQYLVVQSYDEYAQIHMMYAMPYSGVSVIFHQTNLLFLGGSVLVIVLLLISFRALTKLYLNPLKALVDTMEQIKSGNMDKKMSYNNDVLEFQQMSDTFNEMLDQIKLLKISTYEYQIEIQQAKLQYLQIQIRPHFFLNCLKNIYGLAQQQKYEQIQDVILALSEHLRNLFGNNLTLVEISTEIQSVKNYILLQQLSGTLQVSCEIALDEKLEQLQVPPLSIQTFVENSIKHGTTCRQALRISIKISLFDAEDQSFVHIKILDNGTGFSAQTLEQLNGQTEKVYPKEHIGIQNVIHRFSLIYQQQSTFCFSNITGGGACVEIFIPADACSKRTALARADEMESRGEKQ